ncbi:protein WVD2-like 7 isoform X2 [Salvia miltiorrhiza]|nr:protein WVD2-like 7 isoform X2 [Salvia miltiorrhiza]XP_057774731.1 protein WVD2-like 7 isoform X2 [Salvia miltiorrhiza]
MDDSAKSGARLEVSVSFGRFENDALSWEKWSSFSPNKYLEEVGSLSTPGSVAQKKAYFEAHYKKIAARKAEEMEQDSSISPIIPSPSKEDHSANSSENGAEFDLFSDERLVEEVGVEACATALTNVVIADEEKDDSARSSKEDEEGSCMNGVVASEEETGASVESGSSVVQEPKDEANAGVDNTQVNVSKDALLVVKDSQLILERPRGSKNVLKQSSVVKKENSKLNTRNVAQKVPPMNKEKNSSMTRKKVVTPPAKPLPATTPRHVKPTSIPSPISAPQSLKKKVNNSAPPKMKSSQVGQSKKVAPTSLHMSLSLGPAESLAALPMTRKSLIMESMGDKDIVRRAFKTFQNRTTNGFATDEKPTIVKHASSTACEPKTSSYHTPTKGNEGLRKEPEKRTSQRIQSGTRSNPLPTGLRKNTALDKKSPTTPSPVTGLRSDDKAEKRKEFLKKLGAKSIAREAEKAQHAAKAKVRMICMKHSKTVDLSQSLGTLSVSTASIDRISSVKRFFRWVLKMRCVKDL